MGAYPLTLLRFTFAAIAATAVLLVVSSTRADVDLWGHLRFGLDILEHGRLDREDPYSFTSDRTWVNHEWLSEVVFAIAWNASGNTGLILVKLSCMLGALAIVAVTLRRYAVASTPRVIILCVSLLGILPRSTHVRPQLFSVLLFAVLLLICDLSERVRPRILLWTVPLMSVWANLHGGWIVGLATLAMWSAGLWWVRRREGGVALLVFAVPIVAAAATLVNPYGPGLWAFLVDTVRLGREGITEWGPIWTNVARLLIWSCFAGCVVFCIARDRPSNPARLLIPLIWGAAAFRVNRLDAFFSLSVVILLVPHLTQLLSVFPVGASRGPARNARIAIVSTILLVLLAIPRARRTLSCVEVTPSWWPEPEATQFAHSRGFSGRMVTYFNWGEYAIWHLPRTVKVSFDGRRETVYSEAIIDGHLELYAGTRAGFAFLKKMNADYIWFPRDLGVTRTLQQRGWTTVFEGPRSVILQPADWPTRLEPSGTVTEHHGRPCFPGP